MIILINARRFLVWMDAYDFDGDLGGESKDIGAGDDAWARALQCALDVVDHGEATH
jgi:hypothetical protein